MVKSTKPVTYANVEATRALPVLVTTAMSEE